MRDVFGFLTLFDWITPAIGIVKDFIHDPSPLQTNSHTFWLPYGHSLESGWNFRDIENLLQSHGIRTWGAQYNFQGDEYFFTVSRAQAAYAEYLLLDARVPIDTSNCAPTTLRRPGFWGWLLGIGE